MGEKVAELRNKILQGHILDRLREIPDGTIQCIVTSPPYYRQRQYKGEQNVNWGEEITGAFGWEDELDCLAWARGDEPCRQCYICRTRLIFREIWRILKKDGTIFYNIGDAYVGSGGAGGDFRNRERGLPYLTPYKRKGKSLKPKDLCLAPQRVALALQSDGWYVRSWITWTKRVYVEKFGNDVGVGMPESCRDRPVDANEFVLLLTKSPHYFYDWQGFALEAKYVEVWSRKVSDADGSPWEENNPRQRWGLTREEKQEINSNIVVPKRLTNCWQINPEAHAECHFAVMPELLAEICIRLGTSQAGECPHCGSVWVRVVKKEEIIGCGWKLYPTEDDYRHRKAFFREESPTSALKTKIYKIPTKTEWTPQCSCPIKIPIPNIVLDPFAGIGTTLVVAKRLGRDYIGVEICDEYIKIAEKRLSTQTKQSLFV